MAPRLVVIGSSNTDLVLRCKRLPSPGETVLSGAFEHFAGGKGANQAVAAARAGADVTFVGACGEDAYGRAARKTLRAEGVRIRFFQAKTGVPSGVAFIMVHSETGENLIGVAKSANDALTAADVRAAGQRIRAASAVVAQLEIPTAAVEEGARLAAKHGVPFILNPAPARPVPRRLLRMVDILTPNEVEARTLSGEKDLRRAARSLQQRGCKAVVITLGKKGALVAGADGVITTIPAPRVRVRDTVGAGDCLTAWLAVGIAQGLSLTAAVEQAVVAASLSVMRPGAQSGMPGRREVERAGERVQTRRGRLRTPE